jgi:hypothetical protein
MGSGGQMTRLMRRNHFSGSISAGGRFYKSCSISYGQGTPAYEHTLSRRIRSLVTQRDLFLITTPAMQVVIPVVTETQDSTEPRVGSYTSQLPKTKLAQSVSQDSLTL